MFGMVCLIGFLPAYTFVQNRYICMKPLTAASNNTVFGTGTCYITMVASYHLQQHKLGSPIEMRFPPEQV